MEERIRVLIVDDDREFLESLDAILSDHYQVSRASGAMEAERAIRTGGFAVMITDYQMPGSSGVALAYRLRDKWSEVVTIVLTGHSEEPEVRRAQRDERVFQVLRKPCDPELLLSCVANAVQASRLRKTTQGFQGPGRPNGGNPPAT